MNKQRSKDITKVTYTFHGQTTTVVVAIAVCALHSMFKFTAVHHRRASETYHSKHIKITHVATIPAIFAHSYWFSHFKFKRSPALIVLLDVVDKAIS